MVYRKSTPLIIDYGKSSTNLRRDDFASRRTTSKRDNRESNSETRATKDVYYAKWKRIRGLDIDGNPL